MTNDQKRLYVQTELAGLDAEVHFDDEDGPPGFEIRSQGEVLARVFCDPPSGTFEGGVKAAVQMIRDFERAPSTSAH